MEYIKTDFGEVGYKGVDWIYLTQDTLHDDASWSWRRHVPLKRLYPATSLHGVTTW